MRAKSAAVATTLVLLVIGINYSVTFHRTKTVNYGNMYQNQPDPQHTAPANISTREFFKSPLIDMTSGWAASTALINPIDLCSPVAGRAPVKIMVLLLIPTTHYNRNRRDIIRSTWASTSLGNRSPNIRHAFLFGSRGLEADRALQEESRYYNDIVCYDFIDSYRNLTVKTLIGLKWAATYCTSVEYVLKVDDDNYVNVTNLLNILRKQNPRDNVMIGRVHYKSSVSRSQISKWYVPYSLYPYTHFPPYADGSSYAMPIHVATDIIEISGAVRLIFLEDVYIGMCMRTLKYKLRNQESMNFPQQIARIKKYHCLPRVTTVHRMPLKDVRNMWVECNGSPGTTHKDALPPVPSAEPTVTS